MPFLRVNVSAKTVVAGFQVIIGGRFWVITEGAACTERGVSTTTDDESGGTWMQAAWR